MDPASHLLLILAAARGKLQARNSKVTLLALRRTAASAQLLEIRRLAPALSAPRLSLALLLP
jgi:hypothetical protein